MSDTTVFLVDDHPAVLWGLRAALEQTPGITVVGAASSVDAALPQLQRLQPRVLLVDYKLHDASGATLAQSLRQRQLPIAILFLSAYDHPGYMHRAYRSGALGYLLKEEPMSRVAWAVKRAGQGLPSWREEQLARIRQWEEEVAAAWESLTGREQDVARMLARGLRNAEIAEALGVSVRTVEYHVANVLGKLGLRNRAEVAGWMAGVEMSEFRSMQG